MIGLREPEIRALVLDVEPLEFLVRVGDLPDVHSTAHFTPEVEGAQALLLAERPPAVSLIPADRLEDESGEDIEEILVADRESTVDLVHPAKRGPAAIAVIAPFHQLADDQVGVVVPSLRPVAELAPAVQPPGKAGHAIGSEQGELERAGGIEREVVAPAQEHDALTIAHRIEGPDLFNDGFQRHIGTRSRSRDDLLQVHQLMVLRRVPTARPSTRG